MFSSNGLIIVADPQRIWSVCPTAGNPLRTPRIDESIQAAALAETEGPSRHELIVVASRSAPFLVRSAEALSSRGISASHVVGTGVDLTSHDLRMNISAALRGGMLRVLYLHTHLLQDHTLISAIDEAHGGLHMLVIDESNTAPSVRIVPPAIHSSASIR